LKQKIEASFGSVDACKKELATAATTQLGSWAWLVLEADKLRDHEGLIALFCLVARKRCR